MPGSSFCPEWVSVTDRSAAVAGMLLWFTGWLLPLELLPRFGSARPAGFVIVTR